MLSALETIKVKVHDAIEGNLGFSLENIPYLWGSNTYKSSREQTPKVKPPQQEEAAPDAAETPKPGTQSPTKQGGLLKQSSTKTEAVEKPTTGLVELGAGSVSSEAKPAAAGSRVEEASETAASEVTTEKQKPTQISITVDKADQSIVLAAEVTAVYFSIQAKKQPYEQFVDYGLCLMLFSVGVVGTTYIIDTGAWRQGERRHFFGQQDTTFASNSDKRGGCG